MCLKRELERPGPLEQVMGLALVPLVMPLVLVAVVLGWMVSEVRAALERRADTERVMPAIRLVVGG